MMYKDAAAAMLERADGIQDWLVENDGMEKCCVKQEQHIEGSDARLYWHHGYMMALRDAARLLKGSANGQRPKAPSGKRAGA